MVRFVVQPDKSFRSIFGERQATVAALLRLKKAETSARLHAETAEKARHELAQLNANLELRVSDRTAELREANESLREFSGRLLKIQDDERRGIAPELHDGVGQLLGAISMNMGVIGRELDKLSPRASNAFIENREFIKQVLQSIRTMSHLLHPPVLDEVGLAAALREYAEEFGKRSGIKVSTELPTFVRRFSSELETAIFGVVQECLGNIHRHSGSPTAQIRLEVSADVATLTISDAGRGIPQDHIKSVFLGGVGLRGMRERVAHLGGQLTIEADSQGTIVGVTLPCKSAFATALREVD